MYVTAKLLTLLNLSDDFPPRGIIKLIVCFAGISVDWYSENFYNWPSADHALTPFPNGFKTNTDDDKLLKPLHTPNDFVPNGNQ